jgi:hypothetical protein
MTFHKGLHTWRTLEKVQVRRNGKAPITGAFAEPSDGLEPSTPSLPWSEQVCRAGFWRACQPVPLSVSAAPSVGGLAQPASLAPTQVRPPQARPAQTEVERRVPESQTVRRSG